MLLDRPSRSASPLTIRQKSPELTDRLNVRLGSIAFGGSSGAPLNGRACRFESTARDRAREHRGRRLVRETDLQLEIVARRSVNVRSGELVVHYVGRQDVA